MRHQYLILAVATLIASCATSPREQAVAINIKAMEIIHDKPMEAIPLLNKSIAADPTYHPARWNKVCAYIHQGDYENAAKSQKDVIKLRNKSALFIVFLGNLLEKTGKTEEAKEQYIKAQDVALSRLAELEKSPDTYAEQIGLKMGKAASHYFLSDSAQFVNAVAELLEDTKQDSVRHSIMQHWNIDFPRESWLYPLTY